MKLFDNIKQLWLYMNGKKTIVGASLLLLAPAIQSFIADVVIGIWGLTPAPYIAKILATVTWIGTALTGVGLLHKAVKSAPQSVSAPAPAAEQPK